MKIEIFGSGCDKCTKLYEMAKTAVEELGIEAEVVKVSEIMDIVAAEVVVTPALGIDGTVKVSGRVPGADEIKELLVDG